MTLCYCAGGPAAFPSGAGSIMPESYPLSFQPVLKPYAWGGRNLESRLRRPLPPGRVAESWEVSAHPNGPTPVRDGAYRGRTLPELLERLGPALVGERNRLALERRRFPLLIKLLDAHRWLSVQVHPDDRYGLAHHHDQGKTEMWVVLHAEPEAELILGLRRGVDRERFAAAAAAGTLAPLLHRVRARAGDVFFVPPGTVHALGPGLLLAEIQQSSDLTFRLYDWDRNDSDRPLHLEEGVEVTDFTCVEPGAWAPRLIRDGPARVEEIGRCRYFVSERLTLAPGASYSGSCDGATFEIWGVIAGAVGLRTEAGPVQHLDSVEWRLLPADLGRFTVDSPGGATLLRVYTPAPNRQ